MPGDLLPLVLGVVFFGGFLVYIVSLFVRDARIDGRGRPTTALIVAARPTAARSGDSQVVEFTLRFTDPQTGVEHTVVHRDAPGEFRAPRVQPGMTVPVKFLPEKPTTLQFDWNAVDGG
ncbi:DUF3592 domain-containing protein [Isoptericola sp. F-RaC21]|uniref:DUF3592 domain-containing protein n=1 Tax=Isoptericola sp. F-RaC21 TaxID=3141452 RepID=UPI00315C3D56